MRTSEPIRTIRERKAWLVRLLFAYVVLMSAAPRVGADHVSIYFSSNAKLYSTVADYVRKELMGGGHSTEVRSLPSNGEALLVEDMGVYIAIGTRAAAYLSEALPSGTPLIYCMVSEPEELGLTERPMTAGIRTNIDIGSQFDLIAQALSYVRRVGALHSSGSAKSRRVIAETRRMLPVGWELVLVDIDQYKTHALAVDALLDKRVDVVWTFADPVVFNSATVRNLLLGSMRSGTPVFGFSSPMVRAGALLGVGIDPMDQARAAAEAALELLRTRVIEQETAHASPRIRVSINEVVASNLRLMLPEPVVSIADIIYKGGRR